MGDAGDRVDRPGGCGSCFLPDAGGAGSTELEGAVEALWRGARAAWPDFEVPAPTFASHVGRHVRGQDPHEYLRRVHGSDLYLACACGRGDPAAIAALDGIFVHVVAERAAALNLSHADADEVAQRVRLRLLVSERGEPRIASYTGRGALRGWLRAVVTRTALNYYREQNGARDTDLDALSALPLEDHPELAYIKEHHREDVLSALREAFAGLTREQRNVLRFYYAGGLSTDRIAAILGKGRATVVRWLARGRAEMLRGVKRTLAERLQLREAEIDSFIRMVRSRLDISLAIVLPDAPLED
jgi:RNA polymerase sigma-70 factor (ECF subfamily)